MPFVLFIEDGGVMSSPLSYRPIALLLIVLPVIGVICFV